MNTRNNNHFRMFNAVNYFTIVNELIFSAYLVLYAKILILRGNIAIINELSQKQETEKKGVTQQKKILRRELTEICFRISAAINGWAIQTENEEYKAIFGLTQSAVDKKKENELIRFAGTVAEFAAEIADSLAAFQITAADIASLTTKRNAYSDILNKPRSLTATGKQQTTEINRLVQETAAMLRNEMDKLMLVYKSTNPTLYNEYKNHRIIEDKGMHKKPDATPSETPSETAENVSESVETGENSGNGESGEL